MQNTRVPAMDAGRSTQLARGQASPRDVRARNRRARRARGPNPAVKSSTSDNPTKREPDSVIEHRSFYIGGAWVGAPLHEPIEVVSPHTGEVVGRVPEAVEAD